MMVNITKDCVKVFVVRPFWQVRPGLWGSPLLLIPCFSSSSTTFYCPTTVGKEEDI